MTDSIYTAMIGFREVGGDLWDRLSQLAVCDLFQRMHSRFVSEQDVFNSVFFYILDCYSVDSNCLVINRDWQSFKEERFRANKIPGSMKDDVLFLRDSDIRETISAYVYYQKETNWGHLCMLQDVYMQLKEMAVAMGEDVSADDKYKAAKYAKEILSEAEMYKNTIREKFAALEKAEKDLPPMKRVSLSVEDYAIKDQI